MSRAQLVVSPVVVRPPSTWANTQRAVQPGEPRLGSSKSQGQSDFTPAGVASVAALTASVVASKQRRRPARPAITLVSPPMETYEILVKKAETLSNMPVAKTFHGAMMGGCYVGMAGLLSLAIAGNALGAGPIFSTIIFAALFPVNLLLVLQSGGQLFTGNTATMGMGLFERRVEPRLVARNWITAYIGNICGCGILAGVAWYTGMFQKGTADLAVAIAMKKCSFSFGQTLVKAIMCNWLVCMAVWLATSAQDLTSKMIGIWFPISMFIMIGFEHSVANMFMLPAGLLSGAPLTLWDVIIKNLLPVTIGNTIAGVFVVAAGFSFNFGSLGKGDRGSFRGLFKLARQRVRQSVDDEK